MAAQVEVKERRGVLVMEACLRRVIDHVLAGNFLHGFRYPTVVTWRCVYILVGEIMYMDV